MLEFRSRTQILRSNSLLGSFLGIALLSSTPSLAGVTHTYDALGRIIAVRYDDGKTILYQYDAAGNRTQQVISTSTGNRPPVTVPDSINLNENATSVSITPLANDSDPDGNPLTLSSVASGIYGTVSTSGGTATYTSSHKRTATEVLIYVVSDGQGGQSSGDITINLTNLSPVAVSDAFWTQKNTVKWIDPRTNDTDPGGDSLTVASVAAPAHGAAVVANGGISYTPTANYTGADSFTYTLKDADGATATGTVNVNVTHGASPPTAVNDTQMAVAGTPKTFDPRTNDSDPDGSALTITSKTNGIKGTVTINSGTSLTYTPNSGATGADSFTYTIADIDGLTATATVSMTIQGSNSPPVAVNDSLELYGTWGNGNNTEPTGTIDPRWNDSDPDGNSLTVTSITQPSNGTANLIGNQITIWRNTACPGNTPTVGSVTYTISDGNGGTSTGTITTTIYCENISN